MHLQSIDAVYEDFTNLGEIFQIQDKAEKIVTDMKTRIDAVQTAVSEKEPVSVFVYDSGEDAPFTASAGLPTDMIELAGGKIFLRIRKATGHRLTGGCDCGRAGMYHCYGLYRI